MPSLSLNFFILKIRKISIIVLTLEFLKFKLNYEWEYLALKQAHHQCSINVNQYSILLFITTVVEVCRVGSIFHNQNTEKGRDREGVDRQIRVKEGVHGEGISQCGVYVLLTRTLECQAIGYLLHFGACTKDSGNSYQVNNLIKKLLSADTKWQAPF